MSAELTRQLEQALRPVAARLRRAGAGPQLVRAVMLGAALALVPALVRLATGSLLWGAITVLVLLVLPLALLVRTLWAKPDLRRAALAIDRHYAWQDRITTAWSTLSVGGLTPLEQFQATEAAQRVGQIAPAAVVPLKLPAGLLKVCGLVLLVLCALVLPIRYHRETGPEPDEGPAATANRAPPVRLVPSVSSELAVASLSRLRAAGDENAPEGEGRPAVPDRRLIHDYFRAVCPPGR